MKKTAENSGLFHSLDFPGLYCGAGGGNRTLMRLDPAEFGKMGTGSVSQVTIRPD